MASDYAFAFVGTKMMDEDEKKKKKKKKDDRDDSTRKQHQEQKKGIATDERGRRRFHGAFTGGFSAGYFNTVGSKEGWQPTRFKSSRDAPTKARRPAQSTKDFMDEEELEEYERNKVRTKEEYNAFVNEEMMAGFRRIEEEEDEEKDEDGAGRMAFETAEKTKGRKPGFSKSLARSIIDFVKPVVSGIGTNLLVKMGWRVGKSLGRRKKKVNGRIVFKGTKEDEQGWKTRYGQQLVPVLGGGGGGGDGHTSSKNNSWGIGYDPYAGAEEFRKRDQHELMKKRERYSKEGEKKRRGTAFGLGAFEVDDDMNVYDERLKEKNAEYTFELNSEGEEEDDDENERFGRGAGYHQKDALRNPLGVKRLPDRATRDAIEKGQKFPGFIESDAVPEEVECFEGPEVPRDFNERHVFETDNKGKEVDDRKEEEEEEEILPPPPPQLQKLSGEKRKIIESLAHFVARNGEAFEQLAKQKQKNDKKFSFLFGGEGASSYAYCLRKAKLEEKRNAREIIASMKKNVPLIASAKQQEISKGRQHHDVESRGKLLGEEPLKRTVPPAPPPVVEKMKIPARGKSIDEEPAKVNLSATINEKDKSHILATMSSMFTASGQIVNANMSSGGLQTAKELVKIREEREKMEAVEAANLKNIEKEQNAKREAMSRMIINTRTTIPWSPALLLCKRLGIQDPYYGREHARPAKFRASFKTETVDLLPETTQIRLENQPKFMSKKEREEMNKKPSDDEKTKKTPKDDQDEVDEEDVHVQTMQVPPPPLPLREKPMDLFKAIFEDSDDETEEDESSLDEEEKSKEHEVKEEEEETNDKLMPPPKFIPRQKKNVDAPPVQPSTEEEEKPPVFLGSSAFGKNKRTKKRSSEDYTDDDRRRKRSKKSDKKKKKEKKKKKKKKRNRDKEKKRRKKRSRHDDTSSLSSFSSSDSDSDSYSSS